MSMRCNGGRGMTLIETLVWIAVFTAAMLALTSSVLYFYRTNAYAIQQTSATASAQRGMDAIVRSIREAAYASNGAYPVVSLAPNEMRFYADVDADSGIEEVHYYLAGTSLMEGIRDPAGDPPSYDGSENALAISDNVRNAAQGVDLFTYYDEAGNQMSDLSRIGDLRFVRVRLLVDVDPNRSPVPLELRSSAALRNLIER